MSPTSRSVSSSTLIDPGGTAALAALDTVGVRTRSPTISSAGAIKILRTSKLLFIYFNFMRCLLVNGSLNLLFVSTLMKTCVVFIIYYDVRAELDRKRFIQIIVYNIFHIPFSILALPVPRRSVSKGAVRDSAS